MWTQTVSWGNCNQQQTYCSGSGGGRTGQQPKEKSTASAFFFMKLIYDLGLYECKERRCKLRWRFVWLLQSNSRPSRQPCVINTLILIWDSKANPEACHGALSSLSNFVLIMALSSYSVQLFLLWYPWLLCGCFCNSVVPSLFGTRDQFHGRHFSHGGGLGGWFGDDSSTLHWRSPPAVLSSSCSVVRRLGTPAVTDQDKN